MKVPPFLKRIFRWRAFLVIYVILFGARIGYLWYERSRPLRLPASRQVALRKVDPDYLVVIPRFKVVDMADARTLIGMTLWIKAGYRGVFLLSDPIRGKLSDAGQLRLPPMTEIQVSGLFERPQGSTKSHEVFMEIAREGEEYAIRIGRFDEQLGIYRFDLDDLFYLQNPRQLYSHWTTETWLDIETHQVKPRMTYVQVAMSLGNGELIRLEGQDTQVYRFSSHPGGAMGITEVRFVDGRLAEYQTVD